MRKMPSALLIAAALFLSACGATVQTYEGSKKPADEVAILKTNVGELTTTTTWVTRVDGKDLVVAYSDIELLPGRRSLGINLTGGILRAAATVSLDAKAGRIYRLHGTVRGASFLAWIVDQGTGEVVAGQQP